MKKSSEQLLVLTGFKCNNNCIVCSIAGREREYANREYEDIVKDLQIGRQNGCDCVEFTGGEPTIRKDIVKLIGAAKEMGYITIALSTNGRFFSYAEYCKKAVEAGLNKVTFSLLGPNKSIHDAITRTPGTFEQITSGIKNLQKFEHVHINISTVISNLNYKNLQDFGKFILSIGIRNWYLLDQIPDGNAKLYYRRLVVRLKDLYNELNGLFEIGDQLEQFGFFDFPMCLFRKELKNKKNAIFINTKMRHDTSHQVGYNSKRITSNEDGKYFDVYRQNIDICKQCVYYKECGGIWREYLDLFGEEEIAHLFKTSLVGINEKKFKRIDGRL
jgi:MoaA/NifB/PqqE/SkfB family radical SAM enzyme